ncbi:thioredoxin-dependent thiol peroxidase [Candidatus Uhrbacteria bacterium]|nr:thioredoxin-dependent thiol peroxidase [Candidatus Uhrbacteria bacterium]MBI4598942.1 thioredoxin-dependent thiol peroxidase [Candidatus Uhrbacteria bacterium]
MTHLHAGEAAPDFSLPDQEGKAHALSAYRGQWVLLYFYPKDDTPGCTTEACGLRDVYPDFERLGIQVFGISTDSVKSHGKFVQKYELPFTLLADEEKTVVNAYGVWGKKKFMGREYMGTARISFLIDPQGAIAKVYGEVKPAAHAVEVLADMQALEKGRS